MTPRRYWFRSLLRSRSIGAQLALLVALTLVVAFAGLGALVVRSTSSALEQAYEASARAAIGQAHAGIDWADAQIEADARRAGGLFATMVGSSGQIGPGAASPGGAKAVPVLSVDGRRLNGDTALVDRFAAAAGVSAAVWVMRDGEAVRIASSVTGAPGERSLGTVASRESAAYAAASGGSDAIGRETGGARERVVAWHPIRDARGRVVGLTSVAIDATDALTRLKSRLREIRVGEHGRLQVYDARPGAGLGTAIVHPDPAVEGRVRLDARDATDGRAYIREFIERGSGVESYVGDEADARDAAAGTKTAVLSMHPTRRWLVVASLPDRESRAAGASLLTRLTIAAVVVCAVIALLLYFAIRLTVSKPLAHAVRVADAVAAGRLDLEIHPRGRDEIGLLLGSMGRMVERLRDLVGRIQSASDQVERSSRQIAGGSAELARRAETDAGSLKETADSMTQLASMVRQSSEDAKQASALAESASATASRGGAAVSAVVATMDGITEASRRIADIIGVIDSIAFQTNILALNAAVEAARAGEQGRGFAVVAGEVRALAQRSASAAREIKTLIGESVARVESGSKQVGEAGRTMDDIVSSVGRVTELIVGISSGMSAQTGDLERLHEAIGRMDRTTQFNAVLVEEAAGAASAMEDEAHRLAAALTAFHLQRSSGAKPVPPARTAVRVPSRETLEEAES